MKRRGLSSTTLAFLIVAVVVVASAAVVATQVSPPARTTSTQQIQMSYSGSSTTASQNGLRLTLGVNPTAIYSGGSITVSISDFNTLAAENTPVMTGPPTVGGTTLTLGPCNQYPLGIGVFQGYYEASNLSQALSLSLFQPGVYSCPAEFPVAYFTFSPTSDEISLYSTQPTGSGNSTAPTLMWTNTDASSQNFSGYWTVGSQVIALPSGTFHPFQPGVYTLVGGDDWGQLAILHFTVSPSSSTTSTTGHSSGSEASSTVAASFQGLQLRLGLNATVIQLGESLQVAVSEFNTLATSNNVSAAKQWPTQVALGSCQNIYAEPFGIAVYSGHVDAQNLSQAKSLEIFPIVPCPMYIRLVTGYDFQPQSASAVVLPGSGVSPMSANINVSMIYSGQPQPLPQGTYTVVAADEWGALAFLYFTVV